MRAGIGFMVALQRRRGWAPGHLSAVPDAVEACRPAVVTFAPLTHFPCILQVGWKNWTPKSCKIQ